MTQPKEKQTFVCPSCQRTFTLGRCNQRFCSVNCKNLHHNERKSKVLKEATRRDQDARARADLRVQKQQEADISSIGVERILEKPK